MRRLVLSMLLLSMLACLPLAARAGMVRVEPSRLGQGQPALVRACLGRGVKDASAMFLGKEVPLVRGADGCFWGAVAADLLTRPGGYQLTVLAKGRPVAATRVRVVPKDYGERRITVAKKFMRLTPQQLRRHQREIKAQRRVYALLTPRRFWRGAFVRPVPGAVSGPFGRRSVINGEPRSPHSGVDLRARKGDPVRAAGAGRVALVQDSYFGGKTILIDHGQGVVTGYRHLDRVLVKKGQMVAKGQVIGRVGMTGRVTGPHLHFDVHLSGARVDPLAWLNISKRLAGRLAGRRAR